MQPELFQPDECRRVAALPHDQREWTRAPVDTSGPAACMILVRAPGDPERRSREARHAVMGVVAAAGEWKALRKDSVDVWAGRFTELLRSGPRTLNALTVEAADATADMVGPNAIAALWALKAAGVVEHTIDVPVLWRLVK